MAFMLLPKYTPNDDDDDPEGVDGDNLITAHAEVRLRNRAAVVAVFSFLIFSLCLCSLCYAITSFEWVRSLTPALLGICFGLGGLVMLCMIFWIYIKYRSSSRNEFMALLRGQSKKQQ